MKVSEWGRGQDQGEAQAVAPEPRAPSHPIANGDSESYVNGDSQHPGVTPVTVITDSQEEPPPKPFRLPIDPFRYIGGVMMRAWMIVIAMGVGLVIGAAAGFFKFETRYEASALLMKREIPSSFRVGEIGEPYRPPKLSNETLKSTVKSVNVMQRVVAKSEPKTSLGMFKLNSEIEEERKTSFLRLIVTGSDGEKATADLANLWANEVIEFTREMQIAESREIRQHLEEQVSSTGNEMRRIDQLLLKFSKEKGLINAEKQVDSYLRSVSDLELRYQTARLDLEAVNFRIKSTTSELHRQSPLSKKVKEEEAALTKLRNQFTEVNPLVIQKCETVERLQRELEELLKNPSDDPGDYAGTFLGNTLYLKLLELRNNKQTLERRVSDLEVMLKSAKQRLDGIPEKVAEYARMEQQRVALQMANTLLEARLREARLFEKNAMGFYRIFTPASEESVGTTSKWLKILIVAVGGAFGLGGMAGCLTLVLEFFDFKTRTSMELSNAFESRTIMSFPKEIEDPDGLGQTLWTSWINEGVPDREEIKPQCVWIPELGEWEATFWGLVLPEALSIYSKFILLDIAPKPSPIFRELPLLQLEDALRQSGQGGQVRANIDPASMTTEEAKRVSSLLEEFCRRDGEVWVRMEGRLKEPQLLLMRSLHPAVLMAEFDDKRFSYWNRHARLLKSAGVQVGGVVVFNEKNWWMRWWEG